MTFTFKVQPLPICALVTAVVVLPSLSYASEGMRARCVEYNWIGNAFSFVIAQSSFFIAIAAVFGIGFIALASIASLRKRTIDIPVFLVALPALCFIFFVTCEYLVSPLVSLFGVVPLVAHVFYVAGILSPLIALAYGFILKSKQDMHWKFLVAMSLVNIMLIGIVILPMTEVISRVLDEFCVNRIDVFSAPPTTYPF